ncbi:hypothetical protein [Asanoa siamensis]|uniref:Centromere-binding protein ParB C-terminal domain-containing protein n=1 Tax=Asanoa siamensis TaxID=926357 RepID=A0ABQ4CKS9_9ACTN|nr:hypothetical protein [Asanoa siamensis]GIF71898.1 hypothetical protein Asi02nite_14160 [Asanoa siamensis]
MLSPESRTMRARIAAHTKWANTDDPSAATAPARKAFADRFITQAREQFGDLPEAELTRRAEHLRQAHFQRMAFRSAQARKARKAGAAA